MTEYFYLVSSLPSLRFEQTPPISHEEFMDRCRLWLSNGELEQLMWARTDVEAVPWESITDRSLRAWVGFEHSLRWAWVQMRTKHLGTAAEPYLRPEIDLDAWALEGFRRVQEEPSPLALEMQLLQMRWDFVTQLEVNNTFNLSALIIYGVKIQLLERKNRFSSKRGHKILDRIFERNLHGRQEQGEHKGDQSQPDHG